MIFHTKFLDKSLVSALNSLAAKSDMHVCGSFIARGTRAIFLDKKTLYFFFKLSDWCAEILQ